MKRVTKKLRLDRQTMHVLQKPALEAVVGGGVFTNTADDNTLCTRANSGCFTGSGCSLKCDPV